MVNRSPQSLCTGRYVGRCAESKGVEKVPVPGAIIRRTVLERSSKFEVTHPISTNPEAYMKNNIWGRQTDIDFISTTQTQS